MGEQSSARPLPQHQQGCGTVPHGTTPGDKLGRQGPWANSRMGERAAWLAGLESDSQHSGGMTLKSNAPQRPVLEPTLAWCRTG